MSLRTYKKKRNFRETPEPSGKARERKKAAIFVVQEHDASHLHYDFRLEMEGVLKSWAVPKGPSMNPEDKRLAMMVEDHPYDYKDFEGTIPEGNYGAGNVIVWDRGTYHSRQSDERTASEKALLAGLKKGHVTFILSGKKLKGEFALVRLKSAAQENAWLLIKKDDEFATTNDILQHKRSVKTGALLKPHKRVASNGTKKNSSTKRATFKSATTKKAAPKKPATRVKANARNTRRSTVR